MLRSPPVLASRPYNFLQLIENLLIYFPQYGPLRGGVAPQLCATISLSLHPRQFEILISNLYYTFVWDTLWMINRELSHGIVHDQGTH